MFLTLGYCVSLNTAQVPICVIILVLDFSWLLKGNLALDPDCCRCLSHRLFYIMLMQSSHIVLQKALVNIVGFITCVRCRGWPTVCSGPNAFRTGILNTFRNKLQWTWTKLFGWIAGFVHQLGRNNLPVLRFPDMLVSESATEHLGTGKEISRVSFYLTVF